MENTETKPAWWKPAITSAFGTHSGGCLCCMGTSEILDPDTKLYTGAGGEWEIRKNGTHFFSDNRDVEFEQYHDLAHVEEQLIGEDGVNEYTAHFNSPLRDAVYQRHAKNNWVLIEKGMGYA